MAKAVAKKRKLRLKKTVRRTLGSLFLASAIAVAAIPVDGLQAWNATTYTGDGINVEPKVYIKDEDTNGAVIPTIKAANGAADPDIYEDEEEYFQFAIIGSTEKPGAVLLNYNSSATGSFKIPDTLTPYLHYNDDVGYLCAVGPKGFMYYYTQKQVYENAASGLGYTGYKYYVTIAPGNTTHVTGDGIPDGLADPDGNWYYYSEQQGLTSFVYKTPESEDDGVTYGLAPVMEWNYYPCYAQERNTWEPLESSSVLYYKDATGKYEEADSLEEKRYKDIELQYIGNEYLTRNSSYNPADSNSKEWTIQGYITQPSQGIFSQTKAGSVTTLELSENLLGIGDFAFYGCTALQNITFNDNLQVIGDYAFTNCSSLRGVTLPSNASVYVIGSHAFENCTNLGSFSVPLATQKIGDYAFAGCISMQTIDFTENPDVNGPTSSLNELGEFVFQNCASLTSFTFPKLYTEVVGFYDSDKKTRVPGEVAISVFQGCTSLMYIKVPSDPDLGLTFISDDDTGRGVNYTIAQFRDELVNESFYIEGKETTPGGTDTNLHQMASENLIAFKFLGKEIYEMTTKDGDYRAVYRVDNNNNLIYVRIDPGMENVTIPGVIGPYRVLHIDSTSFQGNCYVRSVTIPSTIETIAANAFKGCHNLEVVTFVEPVNIQTIGTDAFDTQDVTTHSMDGEGCKNPSDVKSGTPQLLFVGPISYDCKPFEYAMTETNNINNDDQTPFTYITYSSGWPDNLFVRYNRNRPEGERNELIAYPTITNLSANSTGLTNNSHTGALYSIENWTTLPYVKSAKGDDGTNAYEDAINGAETYVSKYLAGDTGMSSAQYNLLDATMRIELPEGIESIADSGTTEMTDEGIEVNISLVTANERAEMDKYSTMLAGRKTLTVYSWDEIPVRGFMDCDTLGEAYVLGDTTYIGDYAFQGCDYLTTVEITPSVSGMGKRPFTGCSKLATVGFPSSPYFECRDSLIIGPDSNGNIAQVVEYLEGRQYTTVAEEELIGITEIAPEAFAGTNVRNVNMSQSSITGIPVSAFQFTTDLDTVTLPYTLTSISRDAFSDSAIKDLIFSGSKCNIINSDAFRNTVDGAYAGLTNLSGLTFYSPDGSYAQMYANDYNIRWKERPQEEYFTVEFRREDNYELLYRAENVRNNTDVRVDDLIRDGLLVLPEIEGKIFDSWFPEDGYLNVTADTIVYARYKDIDPDSLKYNVTFVDVDAEEGRTVIDTQRVAPGEKVREPAASLIPTKQGKEFIGWVPYDSDIQFADLLRDSTILNQDVTYVAQYRTLDSSEQQFVVRFIDDDEDHTVLKTEYVMPGKDAYPPKDPSKEGYVFAGWYPSYTNIQADTDIYAQYEKLDSTASELIVRFIDWDDTVLNTQRVKYGEDAIIPASPSREGYTFTGWRPNPVNVITNMDVYAQYEPSGSGSGSGSGDGPGSGSGSGGTTVGDYYTLTVRNGSGSGSYLEGAQAIIVADDPASGMTFDKWTIEPADAAIASTGVSATVVTMPAKNVVVTANYKKSSGSGVVSGSGSTATGNSSRPGGSTGSVNKGTTVVIDKNGLSNTGVVSATVNGSSDNFVIKITESSAAAEAAVKALMAEYGSLDGIQYFPMDISLYDSTGNNKITDTTGLSVTITLPIPDSLITYAGNNRVASTKDNRLEKLSARFTTISGVSCITFTATHFSPYVIYVDTNHMTEGTTDSTPKTGDGIHPKWFLSVGLACVSMVFFMKKDKKNVKKRQMA